MQMFHVVLRRSGPEWDPARPMEEQTGWSDHAAFMHGMVSGGFIVLGGPLSDEQRVVLAVQCDSAEHARAALERDPWSESHLCIESIDPWSIRLDARLP